VVTAIKASIVVNSVKITGCSTVAPGNTNAQVGLTGTYFNTSDVTPTPGSIENDVIAVCQVIRWDNSADPPQTFLVQCAVLRSLDPAGATYELLGFQPLGTVEVGKRLTLAVQWDKENKQCIFQRDDQPPVYIPYTVGGSVRRLIPHQEVVRECRLASPKEALFGERLSGQHGARSGRISLDGG
jgi:hypothetical protein